VLLERVALVTRLLPVPLTTAKLPTSFPLIAFLAVSLL
jgi:hypothetical protein